MYIINVIQSKFNQNSCLNNVVIYESNKIIHRKLFTSFLQYLKPVHFYMTSSLKSFCME